MKENDRPSAELAHFDTEQEFSLGEYAQRSERNMQSTAYCVRLYTTWDEPIVFNIRLKPWHLCCHSSDSAVTKVTRERSHGKSV